MLIGHFSIPFLLKLFFPEVSSSLNMRTLLIASLSMDIQSPIVKLLKLERARTLRFVEEWKDLPFPYTSLAPQENFSHSLLGGTVVGFLMSIVIHHLHRFFSNKKTSKHQPSTLRDYAIITMVVASHWFLDILVHREALSLFPYCFAESTWNFWAFGLWNYPKLVGFWIEFLIFLIPFLLYCSSRSVNYISSTTFFLASITVLLQLIYGDLSNSVMTLACFFLILSSCNFELKQLLQASKA